VRDPIEWDCGVPHQDHDVNEASTNADVLGEAVGKATRSGLDCDLDSSRPATVVSASLDLVRQTKGNAASARMGNDGAALLPIAAFAPSWATITAANALGGSTRTPPRIAPETPSDQEHVAACHGNSRINPVEAMSAPEGGEVRRRGWDRQSKRRRSERAMRKRSVGFCRYARRRGWSTEETAEVLGLAPRTLWRWDQGWQVDRLAVRPRGRPPQIASAERQAEITGFLEVHGPSISLASLEAEYPDVARAELGALRAEYRTEWCQDHPQEQGRLEWLCPGSVWAMDFTHPPHLIDGVFPAILNVLDLASRQQLLWLAVAHEDAATVTEALADLFAEHGPPLVMKCDNGPAFRAHLMKRFLLSQEMFTLYSPPYCAHYNGGCERANRTLKELTGHIADQAGRRGFWQSDDLLVARLRANRLTRPWGANGPTPQESWEARGTPSLDKRENMWQHLRSEIATAKDQRVIDPTVVLSHYIQTEIERIAAQPVLEQLGLLHITRRRITPAF
jgi:Integrase core domain